MKDEVTVVLARSFQFTGRIRSVRHAIGGILRMVRCQHNAWVHAAATVVVLAAAFLLRISSADWCWIATIGGIVFWPYLQK
ncbi:MAG: diacylglycerol kinase [Chthoniobacterales bacterium]